MASYAKRIDMQGEFIYKAEALPGALESDPVWRISRTHIDSNSGDMIILWAEGNTSFDNAWDDHLLLSYS